MAIGEPSDPTKKVLGFFGSGGAGGSGSTAGFIVDDAAVTIGETYTSKVDLGPQDKLETATLKLVSDAIIQPCSYCGSQKAGQFVFTEKDESEVRLCSGCLTKAVAWVIAQAKGGLPVREAPADRKACAKCNRHFMPEHLHLVGKKDPVVLCDPCLDQFADSAAEAVAAHRRNIIV